MNLKYFKVKASKCHMSQRYIKFGSVISIAYRQCRLLLSKLKAFILGTKLINPGLSASHSVFLKNLLDIPEKRMLYFTKSCKECIQNIRSNKLSHDHLHVLLLNCTSVIAF